MKTKELEAAQLPADVAASICEIIDYLWSDEERHYQDCESKDKSGHIFESLATLRRWFDETSTTGESR